MTGLITTSSAAAASISAVGAQRKKMMHWTKSLSHPVTPKKPYGYQMHEDDENNEKIAMFRIVQASALPPNNLLKISNSPNATSSPKRPMREQTPARTMKA